MQTRFDFRPAAADSGEPFHPAVSRWLETRFGQPTEAQVRAWPVTSQHRNALIAAPTGSGKTLAAFLSAINELIVEGQQQTLRNEVYVLYVSPLKALSNDIQKNLQEPLAGIREQLKVLGYPDVAISDGVRTGDTPPVERERMRRCPPQILVTTPESLFILLTSDSGRKMFGSLRTIIVDELHAVAGSKRGAHLMLSLERLAALCPQTPVRIGLSATVKPLDAMADFLMGGAGLPSPPGRRAGDEGQTFERGTEPQAAPRALTPALSPGERENGITIIDAGHVRERDLALEIPDSPLTAVMSNEVWGEIYDRLATLIAEHRTTLIFVNQRRVAERVSRHLAERLGEEHVTAHHGSLAKEHRLKAEQRLKAGQLKALVATSSLELGIDIGDIDLVCQLGSPRAINAFLQRVGRAGHAIGAIPKGRLFPLALDDLLESTALLHAIERGELDRIRVPEAPLDALAQQVVAEVSCQEWALDALYQRLRRARPYQALSLQRFEQIVQMLAEGYATRRGRRGAYIHYDAVNRMLRPRRGAKLTAVTNAGVIPDQFDHDVLLLPEGHRIGSIGEDFAFEAIPGDIFQLGNASYRFAKVETGKVLVEDAQGLPPTLPFWFGEGLGRTDELCAAVSGLSETAAEKLAEGADVCLHWLRDDIGMPLAAAEQLTAYLAASWTALGALPSERTIIFERFFDDVGDTHLVIHSPYGSRINRAWGLALRKRFCRQFNFELQASALDDSIVLSLGPTHSFPLEDVQVFLKSATVRDVLIQALLDAPMFGTRWRWAATAALAIRRMNGNKRVPPQFQRSDAEDLLTVVFPDQVACAENLAGPREVPDHPLVRQTLDDCLHEVMDIDGLERLLARIEANEVRIVCRDLASPSPLAHAIINAKPYAFLDDGEAEERRTRAISTKPLMDLRTAADIGRLDPQAIGQVRSEARPEIGNADELHDAMLTFGFLSDAELRGGDAAGDEVQPDLRSLYEQRRATRLHLSDGIALYVAAERLHEFLAVFPQAMQAPPIEPVVREPVDPGDALREIIRNRMELLGPVTEAALAETLGLEPSTVQIALLQLEGEGAVMRGAMSSPEAREWCDRRLLARIHRYTRDTRRAEIRTVPPAQFLRFLFRWHGLAQGEGATDQRREGSTALLAVLKQLEGYPAPAAAWEEDILPARIADYMPYMLDNHCAAGRIAWARPAPAASDEAKRKAGPIRTTPIVWSERETLMHWQQAGHTPDEEAPLSSRAQRVLDELRAHGASFHSDLLQDSGLIGSELENALGELVSQGLVSCDSFVGLRALVMPAEKRNRLRRRTLRNSVNLDEAGRWSLTRRRRAPLDDGTALAAPHVEHIARVLLRRYGVVFRKLLEREDGLPPWRELYYVYRRLEARGEIRGGRFVSGYSGEQFALPEAASTLRQLPWAGTSGSGVEHVSISAADPLNLVGILTPGDKLARLPGNRVLFENGVPVAVQAGGDVRFLRDMDARAEWEVQTQLVRRARPGGLADSPRLPQ